MYLVRFVEGVFYLEYCIWILNIAFFPIILFLNKRFSPLLSVTACGMKTTLKCPGREAVSTETSLRMRGKWRWPFRPMMRRRVLRSTRWSLWTWGCPWIRRRWTCTYAIQSSERICGVRAPAEAPTSPDAPLHAPKEVNIYFSSRLKGHKAFKSLGLQLFV